MPGPATPPLSDPAAPAYWCARWEEGRTGWHKDHVNEKLERFANRLALGPGSRVLVPLCGASLDLAYLAERAGCVVGVEVAEAAVRCLFPGQAPDAARHTVHEDGRMVVVCADFFGCDLGRWAPFTAAYDRGALVALPPRRHAAYAERIAEHMAPGARVLLVTVAYHADAVVGPPFSVPRARVDELFAGRFDVTCLERVEDADMPAAFRDVGVRGFEEGAYLLVRKGG